MKTQLALAIVGAMLLPSCQSLPTSVEDFFWGDDNTRFRYTEKVDTVDKEGNPVQFTRPYSPLSEAQAEWIKSWSNPGMKP